jgi:polysaccharide pyruvyl transferase WcaK-like protein
MKVGVPVMIYAVSAGPLADQNVRTRVRDALNSGQAITVRDRQSLHLLEEIGVSGRSS